MKTYERITDLIGGTPLLKLTNYIEENKLEADIYGKLEYLNPAGSVKDRIAKAMIDDAEGGLCIINQFDENTIVEKFKEEFCEELIILKLK